jgi:hypothetical protein
MDYDDNPSVEMLFRQASMTAHTYFHEAIEAIDSCFGEGYAQEHPELIGAFMQTTALDRGRGTVRNRVYYKKSGCTWNRLRKLLAPSRIRKS